MNPRNQSFVVTFLLIVAAVAMVVMAVNRDTTSQESLTINEVAADIMAGKVAKVVIEDGDGLRVVYKTGGEAQTKTGLESYKETDSTLVEQLLALGVTTEQLSSENVTIEVQPPLTMGRHRQRCSLYFAGDLYGRRLVVHFPSGAG